MPEIDRIHESLEKLHEKIDENTKTLIINTTDLKHHILRTDLLQKEVERTEAKVDEVEKTLLEIVIPFVFVKKALIVISIVAAITTAVFKIL